MTICEASRCHLGCPPSCSSTPEQPGPPCRGVTSPFGPKLPNICLEKVFQTGASEKHKRSGIHKRFFSARKNDFLLCFFLSGGRFGGFSRSRFFFSVFFFCLHRGFAPPKPEFGAEFWGNDFWTPEFLTPEFLGRIF